MTTANCEAILKRVFGAIFPDAGIAVAFHDDETIRVSVNGVTWTCSPESDDDDFRFDNRDGDTLRFPFPSDWPDTVNRV